MPGCACGTFGAAVAVQGSDSRDAPPPTAPHWFGHQLVTTQYLNKFIQLFVPECRRVESAGGEVEPAPCNNKVGLILFCRYWSADMGTTKSAASAEFQSPHGSVPLAITSLVSVQFSGLLFLSVWWCQCIWNLERPGR